MESNSMRQLSVRKTPACGWQPLIVKLGFRDSAIGGGEIS
jgi:hypothetical protein